MGRTRRTLARGAPLLGGVESAQERARALDLAAGRAYALGQLAVGGHHAQRRRLGMAGDERGDVVVRGVAPRAPREAHGHPLAAAGVVRAAVEDHRDRLVASPSERLQALDEPALRAPPVAPPPVGARAHDVVAVDDPLGHGSGP